jgi:hypothetical protein
MNFIRIIFKPNAAPQLGRWNLHYDPKIVHSKVDQANEDHCGCCDAHKPQERMKNPKKDCARQLTESEEYYIPYIM